MGARVRAVMLSEVVLREIALDVRKTGRRGGRDGGR